MARGANALRKPTDMSDMDLCTSDDDVCDHGDRDHGDHGDNTLEILSSLMATVVLLLRSTMLKGQVRS